MSSSNHFHTLTSLFSCLFHFFLPSSLFADVVNCMQTDNLELKKLVYLYLMNYAKSQPDLAILAVNTFSKVCVCWVWLVPRLLLLSF